MTDRSDGAMTPFEVRLARDLHALSAEAVRRVDSERVVENLAGAHTVGPALMTRPPVSDRGCACSSPPPSLSH